MFLTLYRIITGYQHSGTISNLQQHDSQGNSVLPTEVWLKIFSYIKDPQVLGQSAQVCKFWHQVSSDDSIWSDILKRYLPTSSSLPPKEVNPLPYKHQAKQLLQEIKESRKYQCSVKTQGISLCEKPNTSNFEITSCLVTASGLLCLGASQGALEVWDSENWECIQCFTSKNKYNALRHLQERTDGTLLIGFEDGSFHILDLQKAEIVKTFKLDGDILGILEVKDGRIAYIRDDGLHLRGVLHLLDLDKKQDIECGYVPRPKDDFSLLDDDTLLIAGEDVYAFDLKEMNFHWYRGLTSAKKFDQNAIIHIKKFDHDTALDVDEQPRYTMEFYTAKPGAQALTKWECHRDVETNVCTNPLPISKGRILFQNPSCWSFLDLNSNEKRAEFILARLSSNGLMVYLKSSDKVFSIQRGDWRLNDPGKACIAVVDFSSFRESVGLKIAQEWKNLPSWPRYHPLSSRRGQIMPMTVFPFQKIFPNIKHMHPVDQREIYTEFCRVIGVEPNEENCKMAEGLAKGQSSLENPHHYTAAVENYLKLQEQRTDVSEAVSNVNLEPHKTQTLSFDELISKTHDHVSVKDKIQINPGFYFYD